MNASPYLSNAGEFLVTLVFEIYLLAVMLRFLLQTVRADFNNPVSQLLIKVTNPPLRYLRRWIPGYGGIDWPSILLLFVLKAIELALIALIKTGTLPAPAGHVLLSIAHLLKLVVWIYIIIILIQVIISWLNPSAYSPVTVLMNQLTRPLLNPIRRTVPPTGGLDWSPLIALIFLNLVLILLIAPLQDYGNLLAGYNMRLL